MAIFQYIAINATNIKQDVPSDAIPRLKLDTCGANWLEK